ncbi:chromosome partitioning protein [Allochromatium warmingii]|uniref:Chromosome partitioning protein n=1 Tax=Allochromatium warmingii TaxID=61595 RepID=A0A1H3BDY1_ALLWA|nr:hypothetical protein [Allochromatium warmingii]SDX39239.1 chromosome partitioning protein [Allochromatium warmingii]
MGRFSSETVLNAILLCGALVLTSSVAAAPAPLPRALAFDNPRWLALLPPLQIPLPRLSPYAPLLKPSTSLSAPPAGAPAPEASDSPPPPLSDAAPMVTPSQAEAVTEAVAPRQTDAPLSAALPPAYPASVIGQIVADTPAPLVPAAPVTPPLVADQPTVAPVAPAVVPTVPIESRPIVPEPTSEPTPVLAALPTAESAPVTTTASPVVVSETPVAEILVSDLTAAEVPTAAPATAIARLDPAAVRSDQADPVDQTESDRTAQAAQATATALAPRTTPTPHSPRHTRNHPTRYRWLVQVLAGRSLERVTEAQHRFVRRYGNLLDGRRLIITQSTQDELPETFYRLRVAEWQSVRPAISWCEQLLARGHQCFVLRIPREATAAPE